MFAFIVIVQKNVRDEQEQEEEQEDEEKKSALLTTENASFWTDDELCKAYTL